MKIEHKTEDKIIHNYVETRECDCYVADVNSGLQIRFDYFSPEDLDSKNVYGFRAETWGGKLEISVYISPSPRKPRHHNIAVEYVMKGEMGYHCSWEKAEPLNKFPQTIEADSVRDAFCLYVQDNLEDILKTIRESN